MENALTTIDPNNLPAYIQNTELAKLNEEMLAGVSTGVPPYIKLNGKQFALVSGGEEKPVMPSEMVQGNDGNLYMPVIVLRAKPTLTKAWYATAYNPSEESRAPDCFSNDGVKPDPSAPSPQCDNCASCPMNTFGSGRDAAGNATKGKACADLKILAVFVPNHGIHKFKLPPKSLRNWDIYVKNLKTRGNIPLPVVRTYVGFDPKATYPVLVFQFGGFLEEQFVPKVMELVKSPEAEEIANDKIVYVVQEGEVAQAPAAPQPQTAQAPAAPQPQTAQAPDNMGLGNTVAAPQAPAAPQPAPEPAPTPEVNPSEEELAKELGLL